MDGRVVADVMADRVFGGRTCSFARRPLTAEAPFCHPSRSCRDRLVACGPWVWVGSWLLGCCGWLACGALRVCVRVRAQHTRRRSLADSTPLHTRRPAESLRKRLFYTRKGHAYQLEPAAQLSIGKKPQHASMAAETRGSPPEPAIGRRASLGDGPFVLRPLLEDVPLAADGSPDDVKINCVDYFGAYICHGSRRAGMESDSD